MARSMCLAKTPFAARLNHGRHMACAQRGPKHGLPGRPLNELYAIPAAQLADEMPGGNQKWRTVSCC